MKTEHRHELKTNDLAKWLANLPQWAKQNRNTLIYLGVLVVVVGSLYIWKSYNRNVVATGKQLKLTNLTANLAQSKAQILKGQVRGMDTSYMLLELANEFQNLADSADDSTMAAMALIKKGEALRMELHYRPDTVSKENLVMQINQAKNAYSAAIDKADGSPLLAAEAKFGLGLCEEELGNFDEAKQIYEQILSNPELKGTVGAAQAEQRLNIMNNYKEEVAFKAAAKPKTSEVLPPQVKIAAPDLNVPTQLPNTALTAAEANSASR